MAFSQHLKGCMMHSWKLLVSFNEPMLFVCNNVMRSSAVLMQMHTDTVALH